MKKIQKSFLFTIIICLFVLLTGCELYGKNYIPEYVQYNAKLYDDAVEWINEAFVLEYKDVYRKVFKVTDDEKYNLIFKDKYPELNIDYDTQMILVLIDYTYYKEKDYLYHLFINRPSELEIFFVQEYKKPFKYKEKVKKWKVITMDYLEIKEENIKFSTTIDV